MALKMDREIWATEAGFTMNEAAEPGGIASLSTGGSGVALDQDTVAVVTYVADPSGANPVGLLLDEMVDVDLTKFRLNVYKQEKALGSKVALVKHGWFVTNMIVGTPSAGSTAYLSGSGNVSPTNGGGGSYTAPTVGKFWSSKDQNGYAKLEVLLS